MTTENLMLILKTFDDAGVEFIAAAERGPGVRLARPDPLPTHRRRRDQKRK
jgi:hypothetical protein